MLRTGMSLRRMSQASSRRQQPDSPQPQRKLMAEWTKEEFEAKFFDIRKHKPKPGQILAQYRAVAHFVDDWVKRNVIKVLQGEAGAETAQKVLHNMCGALEEDSIRVPLEMAKDLAAGMSVDEVAKKEYRMIIQYNYWTERDNVPKDDPHWLTIDIINTDDIDGRIKFTYTKPD